MKLVRYGRAGKEKPGLIDDDGKLRDLSAVIPDIDADHLSDKALAKLAKLRHSKLPLVRGKPRFGVPLAQVGKFIGIGLNYSDHAAEAGMPIPAEPIVFMKVSYVSRFMTLMPGDIITTGTPPGVGMGMKPQKFLGAGDELVLGIDGLGIQHQKVIPHRKNQV